MADKTQLKTHLVYTIDADGKAKAKYTDSHIIRIPPTVIKELSDEIKDLYDNFKMLIVTLHGVYKHGVWPVSAPEDTVIEVEIVLKTPVVIDGTPRETAYIKVNMPYVLLKDIDRRRIVQEFFIKDILRTYAIDLVAYGIIEDAKHHVDVRGESSWRYDVNQD